MVNPDKLASIGTCFGKFTKSGKFRLHITALYHLAPYVQFLYGHHISKSGLSRITENTPQYQGVVIFSTNNIPLGFGVTAKSTMDCKYADPMATICFHQADVGEYIRSEDSLI
ncbi:60S ribosome subunit biogenesis protein NIP7 like protein [Melipona quadrifasciata]|uniref:60S ribosome subunit biogenesis protein NIP7 like protein n=1 Tax=Melipona quadrifasciata TaxID=166423 RepID=A0A0M9A1Q2_9HYME|nr:60S ribosome subunit biogenesis protein NIP7 like protein [Melipona quadrifasciata]